MASIHGPYIDQAVSRHVWQVLRQLFPVKAWKWRKNVERLPALTSLKALPVKWHKYEVPPRQWAKLR